MSLPPRQDNPNWPLPMDYGSLTLDGQRKARVALCQSWYDLDQPAELITDPEAFVAAFLFWKEYYRKGWSGNRAKYTDATPPMHNHWVVLFAQHRLMTLTCFRGSGKTFVFGEEIPEFILSTRPHSPIQYTSSTEPNSDKQVRAVKLGLQNNELLIDDFGKFQPERNSGLRWAKEGIEARNGSSYYAISSECTQRGITQLSMRSILQILDDPETEKQVNNERLREEFGYYLFDVFFPCAHPRARRVWPNTLLDERAWAMMAAYKRDYRFKPWYSDSRFQEIWYKDAKGHYHSYWPTRFPVEDVEAMAGEGNAERGIISYGASSFAKEFLNDPTVRDKRAFDFDPDRHTYRWEGDLDKPYIRDLYTGDKKTLEELSENSTCVMGVDLSLGLTEISDYSTIIVARIDRDNVMWLMECWRGRIRPVEVINLALQKGEQWQVEVIGLERVIFEQVLIDMLQDELNRRQMTGEYSPNLHVFKRGGGESKVSRIMRLEFRFTNNLIRIPLGGTLDAEYTSSGGWLIEEIEAFTARGTTRYDDGLDSVTTCQAIADLGMVPLRKQAPSRLDDIRRIKQTGAHLSFPEDRVPAELLWPSDPGSVNVDIFGDPDELLGEDAPIHFMRKRNDHSKGRII